VRPICNGADENRCLCRRRGKLGRLDFGIGHGFVKWEALTFGIPLDELRDRFQENLEVILRAWSDSVLNHEGRFHEYHGVEVLPRPLQQPHPVVWMAATTTVESFELAGRHGFHMMLIPFLHEVEELRPKVEAYLNARKSAGHDPSTARVLGVYHTAVDENGAAARAAAAQGLAEYNAAAFHAHSLTPTTAEPESYRTHDRHRAQIRQLSFEDLLARHRVLAGSAEAVRDQIAYVKERLYLTDLAGLFALGGFSDADARKSMRRFMEEVAPKIAG
jgi:alkanesulfonate monooxygenase SsuD/methylene tetrahydromethanopterin reductase-like flavin-dependent oxidoreductase (luciferase family)